jgi:uncharacterized protein YjbJ (UPF0337 family)
MRGVAQKQNNYEGKLITQQIDNFYNLILGVSIMNKDQVKGAAKDAAGKVQEGAGKLVGSEKQQAKGVQKQVSGKVQKGVGDAKEAVKDATKKMH